MTIPSQLLFLPGASGSTTFWEPLAGRITCNASKSIVGYPGFGGVAPSPDITNFEELVRHVVRRIDQPTAIVAQSMGGVIAIRAALEKQDQVTHLVLSVTSGGLDMANLGAEDWRADFLKTNGTLPDWFVSYSSNLSGELHKIVQPTLLLWGDADPYSPVAVGEKLLMSLPDARLHVVRGGHHDLASVHAAELAPLVNDHLSSG
ncbi:alpha/beta hydrolase [Pandoraea anapnoica]|uniref:Alpha/beta hydrolase n=1 Tax=Pandoraea anapnoica TaxID=2508301 RepID=A0A5E5AI44_9BURK|nr:alpha/beta hydrolase [Pandoraea anapnoica]VVE73391.1 alpha/beta hydrolase [Pandoraea anapnoica]